MADLNAPASRESTVFEGKGAELIGVLRIIELQLHTTCAKVLALQKKILWTVKPLPLQLTRSKLAEQSSGSMS
jgi:hypothetical protein